MINLREKKGRIIFTLAGCRLVRNGRRRFSCGSRGCFCWWWWWWHVVIQLIEDIVVNEKREKPARLLGQLNGQIWSIPQNVMVSQTHCFLHLTYVIINARVASRIIVDQYVSTAIAIYWRWRYCQKDLLFND